MTTDLLIENLARRVDQLERANRRWRAVAVATLGLAAIGGLAGQAPPPPASGPVVITDGIHTARLTARGLTVRTTDSRSVFAGMDGDDNPSVDLRSSGTGNLRASMYLYKGTNPAIALFDAGGKKRYMSYVGTTSDYPGTDYYDASGTLRASMFIGTTTSSPEVAVYDTSGKARAYMQAGSQGGFLVVRDAASVGRAFLGAYTDGSYGIDIRTAADSVLFKAP